VSQPTALLYSEDEERLRDSVRRLLADRAPWSAVLARADQLETSDLGLWRPLAAELGCAGLPWPEDAGGVGASWRESAVVLEEAGYAIAPIPFFTSAVFAAAMAAAVGAPDLLKTLATAELVGAVTTPWGAARARTDLRWDGRRVSGRVALVAGALEADVLLVPVDEALLLVDAAAVERTAVPSLDMTRPVVDLRFDAVAAETLGIGESAQVAVHAARRVASALLASEQLGVARRCLEMTVAYVRERRQFGRAIGSYQAIKHRLADVWTEVAQAQSVARYAADCAAIDSPDLAIAAELAQAVCGPVARRAAEACLQLHGGIGFTWEHAAHLYLKRARSCASAFGGAAVHRRRLGALVDLAPGRWGDD
jgi:alkylation response protein AidB-like acyl-CoA dehydrogenase